MKTANQEKSKHSQNRPPRRSVRTHLRAGADGISKEINLELDAERDHIGMLDLQEGD